MLTIEQSKDLLSYLKEAVKITFNDLYESPNLKARQKHPSRFIKIIIDDEKYVFDYTLSDKGRMMFSVLMFTSFY